MIIAMIFIFSLAASQSFSQWTSASGPYGGTVFCLENSGNKIYAGTGNGIFSSTNGENWESIGPEATSVQGIIFKDNYIYALTYYNGVYRTSDNGQTWTGYGQGLNGYVGSIASSPSSMIVSSLDVYDKIFRTTDGVQWTPAVVGNDTDFVFSQAYHSSSYFCMTGKNIYRSSDDGIQWEKLITGIPSDGYFYSIKSIGTSLYVCTSLGIYRSTNSGQNWTSLSSGLGSEQQYCISKDFLNTNILYAGTSNGVYKTTNQGQSWTASNNGMELRPVWAMTAFNGGVYAGSYNGIYKSNDQGVFWYLENENLSSTQLLQLASNNSRLFGAANYDGIVNLDNFWHHSQVTQTYKRGIAVEAKGDEIYVSTDEGVFKSFDGGFNWFQIVMPSGSGTIRTIKTNGNNVYAMGVVGPRFYVSTDNGSTWALKNSGISSSALIRSVCIFNNKLFLGTTQGMYRSTNNGDSWQAINNGIPSQSAIYSIASIGSSLFILRNYAFIHKSTDDGETWTNVNTNFENSEKFCLFAIPNSNSILVSARTGIFSSSNYGETWINKSAGFPNDVNQNLPAVYCFASLGNYVYAGTYGCAVWRRSIDELISVRNISSEVPDKFSLSQNYPNPFNPQTKINFNIKNSGQVKLTVFDILGKELAVLVNEKLVAGSYEYTFNGSDFISGVYFYKLESGNFSEVRKMLLVK